MDRVETLKILAVLKGAYPSFYRDMTQDEAGGVVSLWAEMFPDESYELVAAAVKALIAADEKGFPPHIGAVKARIRQVTTPNCMTAGEAWALVSKAICRSGYNAAEEFRKLPADLQRLVGSPNQLRDWSLMEADTVQSVVASNVQKAYRERQKSMRDYEMLPSDIKAVVDSIGKTAEIPTSEPPKTVHQLRQAVLATEGNT